MPGAHGGVVPRWHGPDRPPVFRLSNLPAGDAGRSAVLPAQVSEDLHPPGGPRTPVRDGPGKANQWIHVLLPALLAALRDLGEAPARSLTALARRLGVPEAVAVVAASPEKPQPLSPPLSASVARPRFPLLPMTGRNGASSAPRTLLNRRNVTVARKRSHGKECPSGQPAADYPFPQRNRWRACPRQARCRCNPYPLPAGSRLLQDLGFVAFTLPGVEKKPRGQLLTLDQQRVNQSLHDRRLRIEHVNSSGKRGRIVKDRIRPWKRGIRDMVMEICGALHNFRVRLGPWQPMI
jgi:hypothetical protein